MQKETLFLDFDGPLFPDRYVRYDPDQRRPYPGEVKMPDIVDYWKMDPLAVYMLNFLYDLHPFQTVVSSSWKKFINKEQCKDLFVTNGLKLNLADDWCTVTLNRKSRFDSYYKGCYRAVEIKEYVTRYNINEYLILDDPMSGSSLDDKENGLNEARITLVDPDVGIGSYDYKKMLNVVKVWAGIVLMPWETQLNKPEDLL